MNWIQIQDHRFNVGRIIDYEYKRSVKTLTVWYARPEVEAARQTFVEVDSRLVYKLDVAMGVRNKVNGKGVKDVV